MPKPTSIYGLIDPTTGELRYVGKTHGPIAQRLRGHVGDATRGTLRRPVVFWIAKLLKNGHRPETFEIETASAGDNWEDAEQFWIAYFRSIGSRLLNLSIGGGAGALGWRANAETREKHRLAATGRFYSEETRQKIRASKKGKPMSAATLAGTSLAQRGENSRYAKLTEKDIPAIRALRAAGYSGSQVAAVFGIRKQTVDGISARRSWKHVPECVIDIGGVVVPPVRRLLGAEVGTAKLTEADVRDIRRRLAGKRGTHETGRDVAKHYGVSVAVISDIRTRKIWRHVAD